VRDNRWRVFLQGGNKKRELRRRENGERKDSPAEI
jgi:hypothetical protein